MYFFSNLGLPVPGWEFVPGLLYSPEAAYLCLLRNRKEEEVRKIVIVLCFGHLHTPYENNNIMPVFAHEQLP